MVTLLYVGWSLSDSRGQHHNEGGVLHPLPLLHIRVYCGFVDDKRITNIEMGEWDGWMSIGEGMKGASRVHAGELDRGDTLYFDEGV
jgi:hypothetical protein